MANANNHITNWIVALATIIIMAATIYGVTKKADAPKPIIVKERIVEKQLQPIFITTPNQAPSNKPVPQPEQKVVQQTSYSEDKQELCHCPEQTSTVNTGSSADQYSDWGNQKSDDWGNQKSNLFSESRENKGAPPPAPSPEKAALNAAGLTQQTNFNAVWSRLNEENKRKWPPAAPTPEEASRNAAGLTPVVHVNTNPWSSQYQQNNQTTTYNLQGGTVQITNNAFGNGVSVNTGNSQINIINSSSGYNGVSVQSGGTSIKIVNNPDGSTIITNSN